MKEFSWSQAVTFTPKVVVLKTVLDKDVETSVHKQEVICHMAI